MAGALAIFTEGHIVFLLKSQIIYLKSCETRFAETWVRVPNWAVSRLTKHVRLLPVGSSSTHNHQSDQTKLHLQLSRLGMEI